MSVPTLVMAVAGVVFAQPSDVPKQPAYLDLPPGVIHVALPPGNIHIEYAVKNEKPLLRLSVGKMVIVSQAVFFGDGKYAVKYEAAKDGIHTLITPKSPNGGLTINGEITKEPGAETWLLGGDYFRTSDLKPGSIYLTTPAVMFRFRKENTLPKR